MVIKICSVAISVGSTVSNTSTTEPIKETLNAGCQVIADTVFFAMYGAANVIDFLTEHIDLIESPYGNFTDIKLHFAMEVLTNVLYT